MTIGNQQSDIIDAILAIRGMAYDMLDTEPPMYTPPPADAPEEIRKAYDAQWIACNAERAANILRNQEVLDAQAKAQKAAAEFSHRNAIQAMKFVSDSDVPEHMYN